MLEDPTKTITQIMQCIQDKDIRDYEELLTAMAGDADAVVMLDKDRDTFTGILALRRRPLGLANAGEGAQERWPRYNDSAKCLQPHDKFTYDGKEYTIGCICFDVNRVRLTVDHEGDWEDMAWDEIARDARQVEDGRHKQVPLSELFGVLKKPDDEILAEVAADISSLNPCCYFDSVGKGCENDDGRCRAKDYPCWDSANGCEKAMALDIARRLA